MSTQMAPESETARPPGRARRAWFVLRAAVAGEEHDYTQGDTGHALLLLAIPMMLEMAMESVFAIVDIFFVASLGAAAVTAVGLTEAVLTLLYAVAIGLGMAVTALVSRRIGAGDTEAAAVVTGQTIWLGVGTALVIGALGVTATRLRFAS
jgi:Na+-driven multidrug efflux pump